MASKQIRPIWLVNNKWSSTNAKRTCNSSAPSYASDAQTSSIDLIRTALASFTEGPVKHNHSPDGARHHTTKYVGTKLIVSYLYLPDGATISLWQRHIGWMSQIFPTPSHLVPLFEVTSFEFMEKFYGSWNKRLPGSRQWRFGDSSLHRFWLIHLCDRQTDGWTDRIAIAKTRYSSSCCCT